MSNLTFGKFMAILEFADGDITKIQAELSNIDQQIAQRTGPLLARKNTLTKQLANMQRQAATQQQSQQNQPAGNPSTTTTPGGSQNATPGVGQPLAGQ